MPTSKDFKRLVRARMRHTGEAYTTARAQLLKHKAVARRAAPSPAAAPAADYARLAPVSDAAIKAKTGCTWERWVRALDYAGAESWSHREIARYVNEKYKVPGWWSQAVTVGYERIKGLRAVGQRVDGSFEASKSRTFAVPLSRLYRACRNERTRRRWLPLDALTVRGASPERSIRLRLADGSSVELWFIGKGAAKSQVAVAHRKLADKAAVTRAKAYWAERLDALAAVLA